MNAQEFIEVSAKTVEEAAAEALSKLKLSREEVKITVVDPGSKGFLFGLGSKPAVVRAEVLFDPESLAVSFLRDLSSAMGITIDVKSKLQDKTLTLELSGSDMGVFIGKRGQTLDSLQYLVNLAINKGKGAYTSVILDSENYRQRRKDTLESLSLNLARKVKSTGRPVVLEPMPSAERRVIHFALQNDKFVSTYSEGEEPFRNVVIAPKKGAKPYKKTEKAEKPDKGEKPDNSDSAAKTAAPEKAEKREKPERTEKPRKPERKFDNKPRDGKPPRPKRDTSNNKQPQAPKPYYVPHYNKGDEEERPAVHYDHVDEEEHDFLRSPTRLSDIQALPGDKPSAADKESSESSFWDDYPEEDGGVKQKTEASRQPAAKKRPIRTFKKK